MEVINDRILRATKLPKARFLCQDRAKEILAYIGHSYQDVLHQNQATLATTLHTLAADGKVKIVKIYDPLLFAYAEQLSERAFSRLEASWNDEARVLKALNETTTARYGSPTFFPILDHTAQIPIELGGCRLLIMEQAVGLSVAERIERAEALTQAELRTFITQGLLALRELHATAYLHRDIRPQNILFDGVNLTLLDLNVAAPIDITTTRMVRNDFYPPDSAIIKPSKSVDLYAMGVVALCAYLGKELEDLVLLTDRDALGYIDPSSSKLLLPDDLRGFFSKLCSLDPAKRFETAEQGLEALCDLPGFIRSEQMKGLLRLAAKVPGSLLGRFAIRKSARKSNSAGSNLGNREHQEKVKFLHSLRISEAHPDWWTFCAHSLAGLEDLKAAADKKYQDCFSTTETGKFLVHFYLPDLDASSLSNHFGVEAAIFLVATCLPDLFTEDTISAIRAVSKDEHIEHRYWILEDCISILRSCGLPKTSRMFCSLIKLQTTYEDDFFNHNIQHIHWDHVSYLDNLQDIETLIQLNRSYFCLYGRDDKLDYSLMAPSIIDILKYLFTIDAKWMLNPEEALHPLLKMGFNTPEKLAPILENEKFESFCNEVERAITEYGNGEETIFLGMKVARRSEAFSRKIRYPINKFLAKSWPLLSKYETHEVFELMLQLASNYPLENYSNGLYDRDNIDYGHENFWTRLHEILQERGVKFACAFLRELEQAELMLPERDNSYDKTYRIALHCLAQYVFSTPIGDDDPKKYFRKFQRQEKKRNK